ncbi:MAG: hypothetical protein MZV64_62775 [Ignavibacteriales bacterium]|nr:hypothetical protein [Ignavibacteriales bacterium]
MRWKFRATRQWRTRARLFPDLGQIPVIQSGDVHHRDGFGPYGVRVASADCGGN